MEASKEPLHAADIVALLDTHGQFAALASAEDYTTARDDESRNDAFTEAMLPDPAVVRMWWDGTKDLPVNEPNYQKWLNNGTLVFKAVEAKGPFYGVIVEAMQQLEDGIRAELAGPAVEQVDEAAPATEAVQAAPAPEPVENGEGEKA